MKIYVLVNYSLFSGIRTWLIFFLFWNIFVEVFNFLNYTSSYSRNLINSFLMLKLIFVSFYYYYYYSIRKLEINLFIVSRFSYDLHFILSQNSIILKLYIKFSQPFNSYTSNTRLKLLIICKTSIKYFPIIELHTKLQILLPRSDHSLCSNDIQIK